MDLRRIVHKTLIITAVYITSISFCHAFDMDMTVDDEIRKNYNPTKLIQDVNLDNSALDKNLKDTQPKQIQNSDLPALPSISKTEIFESNTKTDNDTLPSKPYTGGNIKVKAGTSFDVVSSTAISDWQRKGTKVKFTLKSNKHGKGYTIPSGTVFLGEILEVHQPQITCNGGLVVIKVYAMLYKGQTVPIAAYVTRANDKKIFFNNIKGKRTYLKTMWKKGDWGRAIFDKMFRVSVGLGAESSTLILTPFPVAYGTICLGINTITSPICAFFAKGEHISIPAGSPFRIKLVDEFYID